MTKPKSKANASSNNILTTLPPELITMIVGHLDEPQDWFSLKISCKAFNGHMPGKLSDVVKARGDPTRYSIHRWLLAQQTAEVIAQIEVRTPGRSKLNALTCTSCYRLKPRSLFADSQAKSSGKIWSTLVGTRPKQLPGTARTCISCGCLVHGFSYSTRPSILVGGQKCFVCGTCECAFKLDDAEGHPVYILKAERHGSDWDPCEKICASCDKILVEQKAARDLQATKSGPLKG